MYCKHCGEKFPGNPARCPACHKKLRQKKPPLLLRPFMQLIALLLCLVLFAGIILAVTLTDVYLLTSAEGIEAVLSHSATANRVTGSQSTPSQDSALSPAQMRRLMQDLLGTEAEITPAQMEILWEESTFKTFLANKIACQISDSITGEQTAAITAPEIMALLEENQELLQQTFLVDLQQQDKALLQERIERTIENSDLDASIHDRVHTVMQMRLFGIPNLTVQKLASLAKAYAEPLYIYILFGLCLVLIVAVCCLNYYSLSRGLRWTSYTCSSAGSIVGVPLLVLQLVPALLANIMPSVQHLHTVFSGIIAVLAPVHYGVMGFGLLLSLISLLYRIFRK